MDSYTECASRIVLVYMAGKELQGFNATRLTAKILENRTTLVIWVSVCNEILQGIHYSTPIVWITPPYLFSDQVSKMYAVIQFQRGATEAWNQRYL